MWWKLFLNKPQYYWDEYSLPHIIRAESTHFLSSAFSGVLAYYLILTIYCHVTSKSPDHCIFLFAFLFGFAVSVTVHLLLDVLKIA